LHNQIVQLFFGAGMAKLRDLLKIKKPGEATTADLAREIDKLKAARSTAVGALEALSASRNYLLLAGDEKALDQADREETEHERTIEAADLLLPGLELELMARRNVTRQRRTEHHRAVLKEKFASLVSALAAALDANETTLAAYAAARDELGPNGVSLLIADPHFPLGAFNRGTVEHWSQCVAKELAGLAKPNGAYAVKFLRSFPPYRAGDVLALPAEKAWQLVDGGHAAWEDSRHVPPPPPRLPGTVSEERSIIPHGDFQRRVALFQTPAPQNAKPIPESTPVRSAPEPAAHGKVKRPPRPALPDAPAPGTVRCVVLKNGYPDPEERPLVIGDLVDVAETIAREAVSRGALEYESEASR
jgi:hypothetical protein